MRRRCVKMREAACCCLICDMWGSSRAVQRTSTPPLEIALQLVEHEVAGYVSLLWDIEARDWICVETGGVLAAVSLLCPRCAFAVPLT